MKNLKPFFLLLTIGCFSAWLTSPSKGDVPAKPLAPEVADASNEGQESMSVIRLAEGWKIDLWAAEPDVANVVALDIDHSGRVYVCETFRQNRGVTDNRAHDQAWLMADLSAKTVQDRIDYHKRLLGEGAVTYAQHDDRVRRIEDTDGDGKADKSTVVASGFNRLEEGTGAGVLAIGDDVYFTCIPKLWKLVDKDGDGQADDRVVLSDGYGVRVAFRGHDLHGLIRGYDGRLYFSIGDRGYHIRTADGTILSDPASGAVFRCELDGSGLEVYATGLRNPQELAFNDVGDWFTVDNNSDSGDQARIVHLLRGSDAGWRMYYQYLPDRGPFNRERTWEPANDEQPAYIVPPVHNFTDGPSGLVYYPGTGFGDRLDDTFLICDFRGGPSNSGIRSFQVKPHGASYELSADDQPIWTCLATDVAFGPDSALYVTDWVDGWNGLGKARIYRITAPGLADQDQVAEVQKLLASDWQALTPDALQSQLSHADRRVRLESQWELARRGSGDFLAAIASDEQADSKARLHAVWGLGQLARAGESTIAETTINALLASDDAALLAAASKISGEQGWKSSVQPLRKLLAHESARVRYHALEALGSLNDSEAFDAVLELAVSDRGDASMRHGVASFLANAVDPGTIASLSGHKAQAVRLAAVVALRKLKSGLVTGFLGDADSRVRLEAARTIHDLPLNFAMDALAAGIEKPMTASPMIRRVLNANFRIGTPEAAAAVAKYATRAEVDEAMRIEALDMLANWANPGPLDRVINDHRPLEARKSTIAPAALDPQIDLLMASPARVRLKAIEVASRLGIKKIIGPLIEQVSDRSKTDDSRGKALVALSRLDAAAATNLANQIPADAQGPLASAAITVLSRHAAEASVTRFIESAKLADVRSRQLSWDVLAKQPSPAATEAIVAAVDQYLSGALDPQVHLNVMESAQGRLPDELQQRLDDHRTKAAESDPLGKWLDSLAGGDPKRGSDLFFGKTELSCVRCHKVDRAGGEVGPNLTVIGKEKDPRYLLEAICLPDAKIAKGYETAMVVDFDGNVITGIVKAETDDALDLILADGSVKRVLQDDIEARRKGKSSMPGDLTKYLSARELRDLVAYLVSLKVDPREVSDEVE